MAPSASLHKNLVFVVDDSPTMRELLRLQLKDLQCEPVLLESGEQCLAELERRWPFLVLMDLNMTPMRGDACCQRIKETWRQVPVIIMTMSDQPHEVMFCWRAAADDFLPKPVNRAQLASKIRALREAPQAATGFNDRLRGKKLLLVEDSRFYRNVLGGTLEQAGLQILYARDGREGAQLAMEHAQSIDAALVDLALPKLSGMEVVSAMRRNPFLGKKPILVMSGVEEMTAEVQARALELTGSAVLDKRVLPIDAILSRVYTKLNEALVELRTAERVPFFSIVEFRTSQDEWLSGFSYDISAGGIFVRTLSPAPVASQVQIKLVFAGQMKANLSTGEVAWSNAYRPRSPFSAPVGMGVRFTQVDAQLGEQLAKVVSLSTRAVQPSVP